MNIILSMLKIRGFLFVFLFFLSQFCYGGSLELINETYLGSFDWKVYPKERMKDIFEEVVETYNVKLRSENRLDIKVLVAPHDKIMGLIARPKQVEETILIRQFKMWEQQASGFAHEYCHLLQDASTANYENQRWFNEVLCTAAEIVVLEQMALRWQQRPAIQGYRNSTDERWTLNYVAMYKVNREEVQYEGTPEKWLERYEDSFFDDIPDTLAEYHIIRKVAYKLLPLLRDSESEFYNALRQMPVNSVRLNVYLRLWHDEVDFREKVFIEELANMFGISLGVPAAPSIEVLSLPGVWGALKGLP